MEDYKDRPLLEYLPDVLKEVREYQALTSGEQPEIFKLFERIEGALNDQFVTTATEYGVGRWEKILGIAPKATATLDERKFTILSQLNELLPYTERWLRQKLEAVLGQFELRVDANRYRIEITAGAEMADVLPAVGRLLWRTIPANLTLGLRLLLQGRSAALRCGARHTMGTRLTVRAYQAGTVRVRAGARVGAHWKWGQRLGIQPGKEKA